MIFPGTILCMHLVSERWHYIVTLSPIRWAHTQNDPCISLVLAQSYPFQFTNTPLQQCHDIFYFYVVTNVVLFTWLHVWDISVLRVIIESFPDSIIISLRIISQHNFLVYCQLISIKMVWNLVLENRIYLHALHALPEVFPNVIHIIILGISEICLYI